MTQEQKIDEIYNAVTDIDRDLKNLKRAYKGWEFLLKLAALGIVVNIFRKTNIRIM